MKRPPKFLKKYFWDIDFGKLEFENEKNKVYILRRILNYGDEKAIAWVYENFEKSEIENALSNFRGYSRKSANFWALILGLPKEKVLCLKKRSSGEPRTLWPY